MAGSVVKGRHVINVVPGDESAKRAARGPARMETECARAIRGRIAASTKIVPGR
jgi:hypothetical protein